jgi:hypothetical protein
MSNIVTPDTIAALKKEAEENKHGFVYQILTRPIDPVTGFNSKPGKIPIKKGWRNLTETPKDIGKYLNTGHNLGIVCGKNSNVTIVDLDSFLFVGEIFNGFELDTMRTRRTDGRGHIYFKYNPNLPSSKHHDLGIEILNDGCNAVAAPSVHQSGEIYTSNNKPIIDIPKAVEDNLKNLFKIETELVHILNKTRHCFRDIIKRKPVMHDAIGREYMMAVSCDLKAKGATEAHICMFAKLMYGQEYDEARTLNEWRNIDPAKTWTCVTLQEKVPAFLDPEQCEKCEERRTKYKEFKEGKKKEIKAPLELPPIPQEQIDQAPITIQDTLKTFKKYIYSEEDEMITVPLAEVISNFAPIEPDIMGIIGASGSSKTELIRALGELENQYVYPVSSITSHTLVSGLETNIDLAPMLRGRLLTIKDFTTILAKNKDMVSEIFADLRELTDGHIGKDFGSGVKKHYTGIHTSVLFGCTNAIEAHYSLYSVLGQRIIFFRPRNDRRKAMFQAMKNAGKETAFRDELHKTTLQIVNTVLTTQKDRLLNLSNGLSEPQKGVIGDLAFFLAIVRTHINRDFRGDMAALPEPEYPTRLAKTLSKLVDAHSVLYNREPDDIDMRVAYRLTLDNIPSERLRVLSVMVDGEERTTSEVQEKAKIPTSTARRILDDLKTLEIIEFFSMGQGKADVWEMSNKSHRAILLEIIEKSKQENKNLSTDSEQPKGEIRTEGYDTKCKDINVYTKNLINNNKEEETETTTHNTHTYTPLSENHPTPNQDAEPQQEKQNIESCGICGNPLNGNSEQGPAGLGRIHASCKFNPVRIRALVNVPVFSGIDNQHYSLVIGDIKTLPWTNAHSLIKKKAAEEVAV